MVGGGGEGGGGGAAAAAAAAAACEANTRQTPPDHNHIFIQQRLFSIPFVTPRCNNMRQYSQRAHICKSREQCADGAMFEIGLYGWA